MLDGWRKLRLMRILSGFWPGSKRTNSPSLASCPLLYTARKRTTDGEPRRPRTAFIKLKAAPSKSDVTGTRCESRQNKCRPCSACKTRSLQSIQSSPGVDQRNESLTSCQMIADLPDAPVGIGGGCAAAAQPREKGPHG